MPVAVVEQQGWAGFQGSVAAIRLTQEVVAHSKALGREAECFRTAALAESLNDHAEAAQEHSVLRPPALAVETMARKAVPPAQETVLETCLRWMFEEHCLCLGTQSPSF